MQAADGPGMNGIEELAAARARLGAEFDALITTGAPLAELDRNRAEAQRLSRVIADMLEARVLGV